MNKLAKKTNTRWIVALVLMLSYACMFFGRTVFSVSGSYIMEDYGWTSTQFGYASTAFFIGYMITMIPSGSIADKYGSTKVLLISIIASGLFNFLTPVLGTTLGSMLVVRALEGLSQGCIVPAAMSCLGKWFPKKESGVASGLIQAGCTLASALNMFIAGVLLPMIGWKSTIMYYTIIFPVWCILWLLFCKSSPSEHKKVNKAELEYINQKDDSSGAPVKTVKLTQSDVYSTPAVWLMNLSYACATYMYFFATTWLPNYFSIGRGMNVSAGATPYIVGCFTYFLGGFAADALSKKIGDKVGRKLIQIIGLILAAIFIFIGANLTNETLVVAAISISYGCLCLTMGGYFSVARYICPSVVGTYTGLQGILGAAAGVIAPTITGVVIDMALGSGASNSVAYGYALWIVAGVCVLGSILALLANLDPVQPKNKAEASKLS